MVTVLLSPAFKNTFRNPFSSFAGRYTWPEGLETYSWAISAPSIRPVFFRVKRTSSWETCKSEYAKVV